VKKLLVCQHVAFEILGTLNPLFKAAGFRIRYVNFGHHPDACPHPDGYHGLVLLGGPMSVRDAKTHPHLETEVRLIQRALDRGIPVLGICLGAQLIAKALGARVEPNPEKEIGWYDVSFTAAARTDPLLAHFEETEKIFQWHGDTFEIPRGGAHLARSSACANQAFRHGNNVYGLQFHLEVDEPLIRRWLQVPIHRREIESLNGKVDPERIRHETTLYLQRSTVLGEHATPATLSRAFGRKRPSACPSATPTTTVTRLTHFVRTSSRANRRVRLSGSRPKCSGNWAVRRTNRCSTECVCGVALISATKSPHEQRTQRCQLTSVSSAV